MQWKHEIETHAEGFKVYLWHGQTKVKSAELKKYDVVSLSIFVAELKLTSGFVFVRHARGSVPTSAKRFQERRRVHQGKIAYARSPVVQVSCPHPTQCLDLHFRVILDEAHNIKERSTNAAKAAFALDAEYKWCLSGTPLQNRVGELYSLVRFLGADPFR